MAPLPPASKIRVFTVDEVGRPRAGAPLALFDDASSRVVSLLQSDHAGYVSFVLPPFLAKPENEAHLRVRLLNSIGIDTAVSSSALTVLTVPSSVPLGGQAWLPSIALPDQADRNTSPASFGTMTTAVVGTDGCETILPSTQSEHVYRITQLVPLPMDPVQNNDSAKADSLIGQGYVLVYRVTWYPAGHALGDIVYTLPLAPAETVNLAVVDWARQDLASRREDGTFDEQLAFSLARDRAIDETMSSALSERQTGGSAMTGAAGQYSGGAYSVAGSAGGAYAETNGLRNLSASTVQNLADRIVQSGSSQRRLTTSVVVQAAQAEQTAVSTRAITNHNHCHTLTILYYSVLRQFRVVTAFEELIPVLLIPYPALLPFTTARILAQRYLLEPGLLDPRLAPGFDGLLDSLLPPVPPAPVEPPQLRSLRIVVTTGSVQGRLLALPSDCSVSLTLQLRDGSVRRHELRATGGTVWGEGAQTVVRTLSPPIPLASIEAVILEFRNEGPPSADPRREWTVTGLTVGYVTARNVPGTLLANDDLAWDAQTLRAGNVAQWTSGPLATSTDTPGDPVPDPAAATAAAAAAALVNHIQGNLVYYNRLVAFHEDSETRAIHWLGERFNGVALLDQVENRPIGEFADRLAYRWTQPQKLPPVVVAPPAEQWVSLPVRGVFAEAQLGHCSACETIDDTRFWDWQKSPIPESAPVITDITAASRAVNVIPAAGPQFPAPVLTIQTAPSEPDPTGLAAILTAITKPDIFRDMSGLTQLSDLLQKLAGSLKSAASTNTTSQTGASGSHPGGTRGSGSTSSGSGPSAGGTGSTTPASGSSSGDTSSTPPASGTGGGTGTGSSDAGAAGSAGSTSSDTLASTAMPSGGPYEITFHLVDGRDVAPGPLSGTDVNTVSIIADDIRNNRDRVTSIDIEAQPDAMPSPASIEAARAAVIRDAVAAAVGASAGTLTFHLNPYGGGRLFRVYVRYRTRG